MASDVIGLSACEMVRLVKSKELSCEEIVSSALERLNGVEPRVNAFITVLNEQAAERARRLDARIRQGHDPGLLAGVPVAVKDNLCTRHVRTTCGSRILKQFSPPYDATAIERLQAAGAVILGKANMDEFAMGSSTENSAFFPTRNPWDLDRVPGGSSGGSAAAVSARITPLALGSDTGGSVRQPAAFCGVVGLKPTYGRVSRYGLIAYGSSLDQIGPLAANVQDAARLLQVIAGPDERDSTCSSTSVPDYEETLDSGVRGLRIGVPVQLLGRGVDPAVADAVKKALELLRREGAEIRELSLPTLDYALAAYYILAPAEASSNLARYDGVEYGHRADQVRDIVDMYQTTRDEGFGREVKERILAGAYVLSAGYYDAYYLRAQKVRTLVKREFDQAFETCDLIASPTTPTPAFRLLEKRDDSMAMKLADVLTIPANIAGIPAVSVPCGLVNNLPVGLQLMGPAFSEETILRCAYCYEQVSGHQMLRPQL